MRIRPLIPFLIGVAVALIVLVIWLGGKRTEMPSAFLEQTNAAPVTGNAATHSSSSQPSQQVQHAGPPVQTNFPSPNAPPGANAAVPHGQTDGERMREVLSNYNDMPIDFYGKLVDQFGNPVAGAEIKGSIRVINGVRQGTDWFSTTSNASGLFQFHGKGQDIGMMPSKTGFVYVAMSGTGNYSHLYPEEERAHPDPNNPVILKMWKLQGAEHLIHSQAQASVPLDGTPRAFDLKAGTHVESGGILPCR